MLCDGAGPLSAGDGRGHGLMPAKRLAQLPAQRQLPLPLPLPLPLLLTLQ